MQLGGGKNVNNINNTKSRLNTAEFMVKRFFCTFDRILLIVRRKRTRYIIFYTYFIKEIKEIKKKVFFLYNFL